MAETRKIVAAVLSSGLAVAVFTFVADKGWDVFSHSSVGPRHVDAAIRFEDKRLLLFIRNNSDEPLDLVRARIVLDEPELVSSRVLGAYPDVSNIYSLSASSGSGSLEVLEDSLVMKLDITQAIEPGSADQFGVTLEGLAGELDLSGMDVQAVLEDIKGNSYTVSR